jgi:hypothetical protein
MCERLCTLSNFSASAGGFEKEVLVHFLFKTGGQRLGAASGGFGLSAS